MSRTAWIVFIVLSIGVLGGLVALSRGGSLDVSAINQDVAQPASEASGNIADNTYGSTNPLVTIIEYADFQCPGCKSAAPVMKEAMSMMSDEEVQLIFRSFPLTSIHPNARAASAAAEAAGLQDNFWQMHDRLFETQAEWQSLSSSDRTAAFIGYAQSLGLDVAKFEADLTSDAVTSKIDFDTALGRKENITGTPSIFVNGEMVSDLRVQDGKLVEDADAALVWSNADDFVKLVLEPALEKAQQ